MTLRARFAGVRESLIHRVRSMKFHLVRLDNGSKLAYALLFLAGLTLLFALAGPYREYLRTEEDTAALATRHKDSTGGELASGRRLKLTFPDSQQREHLLKRLHALAQQNGIDISQLSFLENRMSGQSEASSRSLVKYQISMPADGEYPALKTWLFTLQQEFPTLALEELRLRRNSVNDTRVDARIQLGFYYEDR